MPCITLSSGKSVCFESNNYSDGGPVNKNNPIQHKGVDINAKPWMKDNDSWFENIAEFIDPTGITSWDDVRRAGNNYGYDSPEAMIEMAGAVPLLGKIGKSGKIISGGFGLLHDVVKGASYLPPKLQKKVIDVAYPMYQKYAKAGGKELDEALGYGSKLIRDNTPLLNPSKWGSSEKSIQGFNILQKLGRSKSAYDAATGSKDNTGFSGGFGSPGPLQFNGRNVLPDLQSEYRKGGKTGEWMGNKLDQQGFITSATKGGNRVSFTGNARSDEWINKQIDTGKFGYNPKTGTLVKLDTPVQGLSREDQIRSTEEFARSTMSGFPNKEEIAKLPKEQQALINKVNEQKAKDLVVAQNNAALENPVTYAPGAAFFGGLAAPYIGAGLEAATAALELPAVVGGTTIPLATGNNILGLAGGIMGANMLGSDLNTGYYSSDAPMMDKVARGFETGLNIFGTPGVSKRIGEAFTLAGKSLKPNPYKNLEYSGDLYNLRNPVKTNVVRLTPEEANALQQKDRLIFKDTYDNVPSLDYIEKIKNRQKDIFDESIDFTEKWGYQNLDEYKRLQQRNNHLTDELDTLSSHDPDQWERIQEILKEKRDIRERISSGEFIDPTFKQKIFDLNDEAGINYFKMDPSFNPNVRDRSKLVYVDPNDPSYYNLNQSDNDYVTKNFPYIDGVRTKTSTITLGSRPTVEGFYRKDIITPNTILLKEPSTWSNIFKKPNVKSEYFMDHGLDLLHPSNVGFTNAHEGGHDLQNLFGWIDNYQEYNPTYKYYINRNDNPVSARFRKAMVEPTLPDGNRYTSQTWASGMGELHSDLQGERFNIVKDLMHYGDMSMDDAIKQLKTNPEPYLENLIETSHNINKHFKPTTSKKEKLDLLLKLPVIGAGAVGVGAAAKSVGAEEPMQRKGGFIKAQDGSKNSKNTKNYQPSKDVIISGNEYSDYDKRASDLEAKYRECHKGDLECLGSANQFYNQYTARQAGLPTTWEMYQNRGVNSVNAWDVAALPNTTILYNFNKQGPFQNLSEEERMRIYKNIPLGATISYMGGDTGSHRSGVESGHKKAGLPDTTHAAKVIGYSEDGFPIIFDYGKTFTLRPDILGGTLGGYNPQIVSFPNEVKDAIFENVNKPGVGRALSLDPKSVIVDPKLGGFKKTGKGKLKFFSPESLRLPIGSDAYEASKGFAKTINEFRDTAVTKLGIDPEYYDSYLAPAAFGIAGQESEFGTKGEPFAEFADRWIPGLHNKSIGPLQINRYTVNSNDKNNKRLQSLWKEYAGINHEDDLRDPDKAMKAAIIMMNYNRYSMDRAFNQNKKQPEYGLSEPELLKLAYYYNNPSSVPVALGESNYARNVNDMSGYLLPSDQYTLEAKELSYPKHILKAPWAPRPPYKKENGGKNAKTITLSTGKVVTLK